MQEEKEKLGCEVCHFVLTGTAKGTEPPKEGDICIWCGRGRLKKTLVKPNPSKESTQQVRDILEGE